MRIKIIGLLVALFLLFPLNANAWSEKDTLWEGAYLLAHVADWGQTRDIALQCSQGLYYEMNPVIGRCPNVHWVNTYFLGTALLHIGVANLLPQKYRRMFQAGTLGMELNFVNNNSNIGLTIKF
ncbi:MAG: hypothetical protein OEZ58_20790 [Gammaproteobacteria bacterium]|nr:hypothetical protein [Gammaproteobacteria bacterium]MDH5731431.1 hypothetical protein [Gammaproteobacteria bacterium]